MIDTHLLQLSGEEKKQHDASLPVTSHNWMRAFQTARNVAEPGHKPLDVLSGQLLAAAAEGDCERIAHLKQEGADVCTRDSAWYGDTPLHFAALEGRIEAIKLLVVLGADINSVNSVGRTPLHYAAMEGRTEACACLLDLGASLNLKSNDGLDPLQEAQIYNFRETSEFLMSAQGQESRGASSQTGHRLSQEGPDTTG
eukprot:757663-Hanusia_phi.AAC.2